MMYLALDPNSLSTISQIADRYRISRNHLVKVVHELVQLGYVTSVQGRGGGIRLSRDPDSISVGDVVRDMEMTLDIVDCEGYDCPLASKCRLKTVLDQAVDAFFSVLDEYAVSDLVRNRRQLARLIGL